MVRSRHRHRCNRSWSPQFRRRRCHQGSIRLHFCRDRIGNVCHGHVSLESSHDTQAPRSTLRRSNWSHSSVWPSPHRRRNKLLHEISKSRRRIVTQDICKVGYRNTKCISYTHLNSALKLRKLPLKFSLAICNTPTSPCQARGASIVSPVEHDKQSRQSMPFP